VYNRLPDRLQVPEGTVCGIIGFLDKRRGTERPAGATALAMLQALACRGPDSAGVAVFGPPSAGWIVQIKLPEGDSAPRSVDAVTQALRDTAPIIRHQIDGAYLCLEVAGSVEPALLESQLSSRAAGMEIVSLGHQLKIFKQVGSPAQLEQQYSVSKLPGSHAIGHTRLSTESRVDLSHSQPFWAHGFPDLATAHNGHITNYHKLRRHYEQRGCRFFTENDSEVIGIYLRDRLSAGLSFEDALRSSLDDFDGSFSYVVANGDRLAYVRDRFGFKPLVIAETDEFVAIATEEIALRQALGNGFAAREPAPGTLKIWTVSSQAAAAA
jgi:glutamate synthase domain-containing protein 1